ncbi:BON domain-containing protein [Variovorax sp. J22R133]|uniref:BON domain-containing protein n=1 Tax=Variovorax brevis TaxID=3053503 RepID=UPI002576A9DE|nr:BON domain-containing protein [Variovorax sp. J22R133]MDM0112154.1 BON domain-containing protein [Variovorax sp. J22R133]
MRTAARLALIAFAIAWSACGAQERANYFNDPFVQATGGIANCPVPEGPLITEAERRAQTHGRAERGTSCYQSGRCRLPNAYLYDPDIIARAQKAVLAAGAFGDTSVWLEGQRRWVWLKGCVRTQAQSAELERLIRSLDDVEMVMNELKVVPR